MKKLNAGGAIGMLLTLVIISILFIMIMPALKNSGGTNIYGSSIDKKSIEEQVDKQVEEIQRIRQQSVQYNRNFEEKDGLE